MPKVADPKLESAFAFRRAIFALEDVKTEHILIGVRHEPAFLHHTKTLVALLNRDTLGIELPQNHLETSGIEFFSELAEFSQSRGYQIIPLDRPLSLDEHFLNRFGILRILDAGGETMEEKLESLVWLVEETRYALFVLQPISSEAEYHKQFKFQPPEHRPFGSQPFSQKLLASCKEGYARSVKALEYAIELASKHTLEEVKAIFRETNRATDRYMLERINEHNPAVLAVGLGHSENMASELPSHKYIRLGEFTPTL